MVDLFPHDVKDLIASFLSVRQVKQLVLVNRAWKAAGDKYRHTRLHVPSPRDVYHHDGADEATSWAGLRQLLENQPASISRIREMKVVTIYGAMKDTKAILRMVSPFITSWAEAYICDNCRDLLIDQYCMTAMLSHLSLAMQPLPALEHLSVHFDDAWTMTLPGVLRMTPKLTSLCLRGHARDTMTAGEAETWPRLVHLTTLSMDTCLRVLASNLIQTILSLYKTIKRFNLRLSPLKFDDLGALESYLFPIVESTTIGLQTVHFDIPWEDGGARDWFNGVFHDEPPTKHFSCTHPVSHTHPTAEGELTRDRTSVCLSYHGLGNWRLSASLLPIIPTSRAAIQTKKKTAMIIPKLDIFLRERRPVVSLSACCNRWSMCPPRPYSRPLISPTISRFRRLTQLRGHSRFMFRPLLTAQERSYIVGPMVDAICSDLAGMMEHMALSGTTVPRTLA